MKDRIREINPHLTDRKTDKVGHRNSFTKEAMGSRCLELCVARQRTNKVEDRIREFSTPCGIPIPKNRIRIQPRRKLTPGSE